MSFHCVARDLHRAVGDVGLGQRRRPSRLVLDVIEGMGRIPIETAGRLDLQGHVGELVLQGLEVPDRDTELLALLGVLDTHVEQALAAAEGVGRQQHQGRIAHALGRRSALGQHLTGCAVEGHGAELARAVDQIVVLGRDSACALLHQHQSGTRDADDDHTGHVGVGHIGLLARERAAARELPLLGLPDVVAFGQRHGPERLTLGQSRQPALLLLFAAAEDQGQAGQRVSEERTGCASVGQGLGRQGLIEHLESGAPVLFRNLETGHAHLHHPLPQGRVVAVGAFEDLADPGKRTLILDQLGNRFLQHLLLFGDVEIHFPELLSA